MPAHSLKTEEGLKDAASSTLRELLTVAKRYRKRRNRLDTLFLFSDRTRTRGSDVKVLPRATVDYDDSPEMEMMLKHRDAYESLEATIVEAREAISTSSKSDECDPELVSRMLQTLVRLETQRDRHLTAITDILGQLSRELIAQEAVLAKVVAEGARLAQMAVINRERLDHDLSMKEEGVETKSTSELVKMAQELKAKIARGELPLDEGGDGEAEAD